MNDVTITVRGESQNRVAPERATVSVTVRAEGPERAVVVEQALQVADDLRAGLIARADAGTLQDWTSKRLSTRAERPWNNEGRRLAPVHYASVDFTATFAEASELSLWVSDLSISEQVEIGWVNWHLTDETRARVEQEVAASAVGIAVTRARAYASALGLEEVVPLEIADMGLISRGTVREEAVMMKGARAMMASADAGPSMEYEPEEIVISATVEARFRAS